MLTPDEVIDGYIGARERSGALHASYCSVPDDYDGSGTLGFNASGEDGLSSLKKKRRTEQWTEAFPSLSARYVVLAGRRLDQATFDAATQVKGLEVLVVYQSCIESLGSVANAQSLVGVRVKSSKAISGYSALARLSSLRSLTLDNPKGLTNLEFADALTGLEDLSIFHNPDQWLLLDSLRPLSNLKHLQRLVLSGVKVASDGLKPLHGLPHLQNARLSYVFKASEFTELLSATPSLEYGSAFEKHLIAEYCEG